MVVISQDRTRMTNNIEFALTDNKFELIDANGDVVETVMPTEFYIESPHWRYGTYSKKECAEAVLKDMIFNAETEVIKFYSLPEEFDATQTI
jgi:hypothetical protein